MPDHDLLKHVKFPKIATLDTSKTPKASDTRITDSVLASADLLTITKQIQAIEALQDGKATRAAKATTKPLLVPVQSRQSKLPKDATSEQH